MSNLIATLDSLVTKRQELSEKTHTLQGCKIISQSARNRTADTDKGQKAIVTFYALFEGRKIRVTAWPESSIATLPSKDQSELRMVLREEGIYAPEGKDAIEQFSLLKMGEGTRLEGGFEALQEVARRAELRSQQTTAVSLRIYTSKAFRLNEDTYAMPGRILGITKEELGQEGSSAMVVIAASAVPYLTGEVAGFFEGIGFFSLKGWEDRNQQGVTNGVVPKIYLVKGCFGATEEAAIQAFHGEV